MNKKKVLSAIVLLIACMTLTSCSSTEGTYKSAQKLMSQGKFTKAAEKFASLGSYEDAANLAIYCQACALCEADDFEHGIDALEGLNGYKGSNMRVTYYTARSWDDGSVDTDEFEWMQRAIEIYEKNPLYLDSSERIAALNKRIEKAQENLYQSALKGAEEGSYWAAQYTFKRLDEYKDSAKRYTYYGIRSDEENLVADDQDAVIAVATRYTEIGNYLDCTNRAATLTAKADAIVAEKYAKVESLIGEEKYDEARNLAVHFGTYGNERRKEYLYSMGEKLLACEQYEAAVASFSAAVGYKDALLRAHEIKCRYLHERRITSDGTYFYILKDDGSIEVYFPGKQGLEHSIIGENAISARQIDKEEALNYGVGIIENYYKKHDGKKIIKETTYKDTDGYHTYFLLEDGTVGGYSAADRAKVEGWSEIIDISNDTYGKPLGLRADGTIYNEESKYEGWTDIVSLEYDGDEEYALVSDGTVKSTEWFFDALYNYSGVKAMAATSYEASYTDAAIAFLKEDGTVESKCEYSTHYYDTSTWHDIVAIGFCEYGNYNNYNYYLVGLMSDGTVVSAKVCTEK